MRGGFVGWAQGVGIPICIAASLCQAATPFDWTKTSPARVRTLQGSQGMVVSDDATASAWGVEVLKRGGNAVDAAVATAFALAVTRPHYASLGGGGFFLFCPAPSKKAASDRSEAGKCVTVDYRERAPRASTPDMFKKSGLDPRRASQTGGLASGVPGVVSGLSLVNQKWGKLKLSELLSFPILLASTGIPMSGVMEESGKERWNYLNPEAKRIFGCRDPSGALRPCLPGTKIVQSDLAEVLKRIAKEGPRSFYRGKTASDLVAGVLAAGGVMTLEDLAEYSAQEREPLIRDLSGTLNGLQLVMMPPPSSGGVLLAQMMHSLQIAQEAGHWSDAAGSSDSFHLLGRMMRLAFVDRARYLGDPDFSKIPVSELTSMDHVRKKWMGYDPRVARDSGIVRSETRAGVETLEPHHTTHFSVIDRQGNAVGITTTINGDFGSGVVPPGTGIVLNNQMDDFALGESANLFGLVTGPANRVEAGKRPLSSMSPTIVRDEGGRNRIVLGAEGGPKIITSVFQTLIYRLVYRMALPDAVEFPRVHHQWLPTSLRVESPVISEEVKANLKKRGYELEESVHLGVVNALERTDEGRVISASDVRGEGGAAAE